MREIKFRALNDDMANCNWMYGCLVYDAIGNPRITAVDSSGKGLTFHTCINGTVGQFTGLKDKNGVDIYEGDIVQRGIIVFQNGKFQGCYYEDGGGLAETWEDDLYHERNIEVLGNIHEHKHLLNTSAS